MRLDLDALERNRAKEMGYPNVAIEHDELDALVRIARAAAAWRDTVYRTSQATAELCDALREAGL